MTPLAGWFGPWAVWRAFVIGWRLAHLYVRTKGFRSPARGDRVLKCLVALGGAFVKFGQWMSVRPDFVPPDIAEKLSVLQDDMPPLTPEVVKRVLESWLPGPIEDTFESFDFRPLSAASIAQVHVAVLKATGQRVAVKVQRPDIRHRLALDIAALRWIAGILPRFRRADSTVDLRGMIDVFARTLEREVNFLVEARNQERARRLFEQDPDIRVPAVIFELTSTHVLVMEYLAGVKLKDLDKPAAQGLDLVRLGNALGRSFFNQFFRYGFYQADPHPGNFLFLPDDRLGMVDFGIVGIFDESVMEALTDWVRAIVLQDTSLLTQTLMTLGTPRRPIDELALRSDLKEYLMMFEDMASRTFSYREVAEYFTALLHRHQIHIPPFLLYFNKSLATLDGVGRQLMPGFDWRVIWGPMFEEEVQRRYAPERITRDVSTTAQQYWDLWRRIPVIAPRVLERARQWYYEEPGEIARLRAEKRRLRQTVREGLVGGLVALALYVALTAAGVGSEWGAPWLPGAAALALAAAIWLVLASRTRPR